MYMTKKNTEIVLVNATDLRDGQMLLTNSGSVKEVDGRIRSILPPYAPVRVLVQR